MAQTARVYDSYHEYDADNYIPNDRFYVRSSVYLPGGDVDARTGMVREDTHRHGRTQALRMEADQLDQEYARMDASLEARKQEKGVRMSLRKAAMLVLASLFLFAVILLVQQGTLAQRQRSLKTLNQRMEEIKGANDGLKAQIADASDSSTICYAAARDLGMVPASSAQAIHLTAVDTRPDDTAHNANASAGAQVVAEANASAMGSH